MQTNFSPKLYEVEVVDSFKNESLFEVRANSTYEARFIGRNLHIKKFNYRPDRLPVIETNLTIIEE